MVPIFSDILFPAYSVGNDPHTALAKHDDTSAGKGSEDEEKQEIVHSTNSKYILNRPQSFRDAEPLVGGSCIACGGMVTVTILS